MVRREKVRHGETGDFICEVSVEAKAADLINGRGSLTDIPSKEVLGEIDRQLERGGFHGTGLRSGQP